MKFSSEQDQVLLGAIYDVFFKNSVFFAAGQGYKIQKS